MQLGKWLDIWQADYLGGAKPRTIENYRSNIANHIKPALGAIRLEALTTPQIQGFYNKLLQPEKEGVQPLSAKTIKLIHGILHKALQQAVAIGYLHFNPSDACTLPRVIKKELRPLDDEATGRFIAAIKGHPYETIYLVTLFTGMRRGEILGLAWDRVDFARGTILVNQQLQKYLERDGSYNYHLMPTKNSKGRSLTPAPYVIGLLRRQRTRQAEWRLKAGFPGRIPASCSPISWARTSKSLRSTTISRGSPPPLGSLPFVCMIFVIHMPRPLSILGMTSRRYRATWATLPPPLP